MMDASITLCAVLSVVFFSGSCGQNFNVVEAPKNAIVTTGSVTSTSMWITWDPVPKAESYTISLQPPTITAGGVGAGISDTNSIITGLDPDTEYAITVRAHQGDLFGIPAVISQKTALPSPSSVWAIDETVTQDSMTVQWTKVEGAQSYTVNVLPSTGVGGGGRGLYSTQARLRGMSPNTLYTINVYPVNWVGVGAKATLNQYTKLNPPRDLVVVVATVSPSTIGVQWSEVTGAENYVIKLTPSDDNLRNISPLQDRRYVLRNLEPDTQYKIQVAAVNSAGPSEYSTVNQRTKSICFAVADDFREDLFSLLCPPRCERTQDRVFGTREYTSDSFICAAAIHDSRINSNTGGTVIVKKRPGILDFVGTYNNGISSKDYKNWHRSFVFALQTPENVQVQPGSVSFDRFTLTWNPVRGAASYRIAANPPEGVIGIDSNIEDTRVTLSGLRPNATYRIFVSAVNRIETSNGAEVSQRTALAAPENVQILNRTVSHDRFVVAWDAMGTGKNLQYQITLTSNDRVVLRDETTLSSYQATNLTSGTLYDVSVRAIDGVGLGQAARVSQYTDMENPSALEVTWSQSRSMRVEWKPVNGALRFNILVMPGNLTMHTQDFFASIRNLQPDTLYRVSVYAENANGRSGTVSIEKRTSLPPPKLQVIEGSLTHNSVKLKWDPLANATYSISVTYRPEDEDMEEILTDTTGQTSFTVTGLVERRTYSISVLGISEAGAGENSTVTISTLIMPPNNMNVFSDGLRSTYAYIRWDEIEDVSSYYLSCEPSDGLVGLGNLETTATRLSGFRFNTLYSAKVMGIVSGTIGMNATTNFTVRLPSPKMVVVHSVTSSSMTIEWDAQTFQLSTISYNTSSINRISVPISQESAGKLELRNLRANTVYQINLFSNMLSELLGNDGVQKPIANQTIVTGSNSNYTDVTIFWPRVHSDANVNYLVTTSPKNAFKSSNITENSMVIPRVRPSLTYFVSISSENAPQVVRSLPARLQFTQEREEVIFGGDGVIDITNEWEDSYSSNDGNEDINVNSNGLGDYNDNEVDRTLDDAIPDEEKNNQEKNTMWIAIVIVVACVLLILILIAVPCACGNRRNKPMLRNYGCCGCCYESYVS